MKTYFYLTIFLIVFAFSGCKKSDPVAFDAEFSQPYSTGIIKFEYELPHKDTTVRFTSIGDNPAEKDDYGYTKPSVPWTQIHRLNPDDFLNRAFISFSNKDINTLTLPYTYKPEDHFDAAINYILGQTVVYDASGNASVVTNTFAGSTRSNDFHLTILSKVNNRLQGTFSGKVTDLNGFYINITQGIFDVVIVNK